MSEIHFVLPRQNSIVTHSLYYETPWHGKETMGSFCIVVELQNISYCLNKCAMFVHVKTNLDRLSQISPIPNLTTTRLVTAEVTHRTDGRMEGEGKANGHCARLIRKSLKEKQSHMNTRYNEAHTVSRTVLTACSTGLPSAVCLWATRITFQCR
jgi:hypothetical protein